MAKAALYTANDTAAVLTAGSTIPLGSAVHGFGGGCCNRVIALNGNAITLNDEGYYLVNANVTAAATAAGELTATLYQDGAAVSGAVSTVTATAAGDVVVIPVNAIVRVLCGRRGSSLSLVLSGGGATISDVAVTVVKL